MNPRKDESHVLQIRHDLLHCLYIRLIRHSGLSEISLPLGGLLGQDMALVGLESHKFAGAGLLEALGGCSFCLNLGHSGILLLLNVGCKPTAPVTEYMP